MADKVKLDFTYEVNDYGEMTIYYIYKDKWFSICDLQDCDGLSDEELNRLADDCLFEMGCTSGDYFQAETDEQAKANVIPREMK